MRIFNADETIFTSNGLKSLEPIYCHEIRNESEWYLDVRVPLSFLDFIIQDNIIVAETLDKGEQAFRIRNISVGQDIKFEAWHIGYDSRVFSVELSTFVNLNPTQALTQLLTDTQTNNFTVFSNIATQLSFSIIDVPLYDALIDMAERYNAILEFDNWQIRLVSSIGSDKGVTVAYGKNLESSSFEENWDMVCTELTPRGNDGLVGTKIYSSIVYDRPYAKIVSFDTDDLTTLNNLAGAYLSRFEKPRVNYKVKSDVILASLGDTIKVEAKQFSLFTEVLSYKFNVITRRMMELEFGNFRPTIRNAIGQLRTEVVEQSRTITQLKIDEVNNEISAIVSDIGNLDGRLDSAEAKITPTAITSTVRSSTEYTNDLGGKENTVFKQNTAPTHLNGRFWLDTSVTPNVLNRSNGSAWIKATPTQASEVGAYSSGQVDTILTDYSTITQTSDAINLEIGKVQVGGTNLIRSSNGSQPMGMFLGAGADILYYSDYVRGTGNSTVNPSYPRIRNASTRGLVLDLTKQYTLSFEARANANANRSWTISVATSSNLVASGETAVTTSWNRFEYTFTPAVQINSTTDFFIYCAGLTGDTTSWLELRNVQLEIGNKATAYKNANNELSTANYIFDGQYATFKNGGLRILNNAGTTVFTADVNGNLDIIGKITANSGKIGRFDISGNDLVYTSDLFDKDYDNSDLIKLHRILLGFESQTPYDLAVYDFNNSGTLSGTDLVTLDDFLTNGTALPTPRKRIRSVVRIGTNNGALTTQAVAENDSVGPTTTIRGEKVSGDLINANLIGAKGADISQISSDGISFSGAGSTNNRTLDDYEEGTWTPILTGETTAGTGTYSVQSGRYTKNGNVVKFDIVLSWSAHTGTGHMGISLPFANGSVISSCSVVASNLTFSNQLGAFILASGSKVFLQMFGSNGARAYVNMDTTGELFISGSYMV